MTGYTRDAFGPIWADTDHNGSDTRNDVLRLAFTNAVLRTGCHGCVVASGVLTDPCTGHTIELTRGTSTSMAAEIDHVVSLADPRRSDPRAWDPAVREEFANDPLLLQAVEGPTSALKGDANSAPGLPPNRAHLPTYATRQTTIKSTHKLPLTPPERDALRRILQAC